MQAFDTTPAAAPATPTLPMYPATLAEALDIAGAMPAKDVAALLTADSAAQLAALAAATSDIDVAMRYQGRKYAEVIGYQSAVIGAAQVLEFPRYIGVIGNQWSVNGGPFAGGPFPGGLSTINYQPSTNIWDWDPATSTAIVPEAVKRACVYQAASRLAARRDARLDARHDGVVNQGGGGLQEAYDGEIRVLCRVADQIMQRYRLRSGEMV